MTGGPRATTIAEVKTIPVDEETADAITEAAAEAEAPADAGAKETPAG